MTRQEIEDRKNFLASVILDREAKLKEHDYVSAKIADGRASKLEYTSIIEQKTQWADDINKAKREIFELECIDPDDELAELFTGCESEEDQ